MQAAHTYARPSSGARLAHPVNSSRSPPSSLVGEGNLLVLVLLEVDVGLDENNLLCLNCLKVVLLRNGLSPTSINRELMSSVSWLAWVRMVLGVG